MGAVVMIDMRKFIKYIPHAFLVACLALMVGIATSNLLEALNRSKQKRTMADMRSIANAWETRATETNSYAIGVRPRAGVAKEFGAFEELQHVTIEQLANVLEPKYARKLPRKDAWGRPFDIRIGAYDDKGNAGVYAIRSAGSDKTPDSTTYKIGIISKFQSDVVFADGNFVRYPEGI
jgi:general secretion pathway protein G